MSTREDREKAAQKYLEYRLKMIKEHGYDPFAEPKEARRVACSRCHGTGTQVTRDRKYKEVRATCTSCSGKGYYWS